MWPFTSIYTTSLQSRVFRVRCVEICSSKDRQTDIRLQTIEPRGIPEFQRKWVDELNLYKNTEVELRVCVFLCSLHQVSIVAPLMSNS